MPDLPSLHRGRRGRSPLCALPLFQQATVLSSALQGQGVRSSPRKVSASRALFLTPRLTAPRPPPPRLLSPRPPESMRSAKGLQGRWPSSQRRTGNPAQGRLAVTRLSRDQRGCPLWGQAAVERSLSALHHGSSSGALRGAPPCSLGWLPARKAEPCHAVRDGLYPSGGGTALGQGGSPCLALGSDRSGTWEQTPAPRLAAHPNSVRKLSSCCGPALCWAPGTSWAQPSAQGCGADRQGSAERPRGRGHPRTPAGFPEGVALPDPAGGPPGRR